VIFGAFKAPDDQPIDKVILNLEAVEFIAPRIGPGYEGQCEVFMASGASVYIDALPVDFTKALLEAIKQAENRAVVSNIIKVN